MGGIFGVASKESCVMDLFFGVDYHSHLGTRRGGMAVYGPTVFPVPSITSKTHRSGQNLTGIWMNYTEIWESDVFPTLNLSLCWFSLTWAALPSPQLEKSTTWRSWFRSPIRTVALTFWK